MKRLLLAFIVASPACAGEFADEMTKLTSLHVWLSTLKSRESLLAAREQATRPNYGGNSFAEKQRTLWNRVAGGSVEFQ
jgi:hypothetical protein